MATDVWLSDADADVSGYKQAILGKRSDCPSLVRAITNTEAGPSSGVQVTRTAAGTALAWITPPLSGTDLTASAWTLHLWMLESNAAANAACRFQAYKYTNAEGGTALLDNNAGTELATTIRDEQITTGNATATTLAAGDRLVFKVMIDDAGTMATGYTATLAYNGLYPRSEGDSYVTVPDSISEAANIPATTIAHVRQEILDKDPTEPLLEDEDIEKAIRQAVATYSADRPREAAQYYTGDGSAYQFPLPARWIWGFSRVLDIEYPTGEQVRTMVDENDYTVLERILGRQPLRQLWFVTTVPDSTTDNILVRYTTRHEHTDELDTIPDEDYRAFTWLAASYLAATLAARSSGDSNPTINADYVSYRDRQIRWKQTSEMFLKMYSDRIRGNVDAARPAGLQKDWDLETSWGSDRLIHRKAWR